MNGIRELVGILLCVQGVGGGLSKILDGGRSWFAQRHLLPEAAQIPASVVMILLGVALLWSARETRA
ncbi:MAG: hypothetical protein M3548_20990 [Actinomycetota bacterium]|nr:hypothetical protein [Actinomycetota bacterium]